MADDNKIKYSDLIEPDDSIQNLLDELNLLQTNYTRVGNSIIEKASELAKSIRGVSVASEEGKKVILDSAEATDKLSMTYKRFNLAMQETSKTYYKVVDSINTNPIKFGADFKKLKQIRDGLDDIVKRINSLSSSSGGFDSSQLNSLQKALEDSMTKVKQLNAELASLSAIPLSNGASFDELSAKYNELIAIYKSLNENERNVFGEELLTKAKTINSQMREINETIAQTIDKETQLEKAIKKLEFAQSSENKELIEITNQVKRANREVELQVKINNSAEGSYDQLSAKYELVKLKLNAMSNAMRFSTEEGKELEKEAKQLSNQMKYLQEAAGNSKLSVGDYGRVWDGLGYSVSQVVRELPAATVSLNTFFLAISNNIPMVVDEINKLKRANEIAIKNGQATVGIGKKIFSSIFSWQSLLIVGLTIFSKYGKQIIETIGDWAKLTFNIDTAEKALLNFNETVTAQSKSVAKNLVVLGKLQKEYDVLKQKGGDVEKFIKNRKKEIDALNVSIKTQNDLEKLTVENTEDYVKAMMYRAAADAARNKQEESFEKLIEKSLELGKKKKEQTIFESRISSEGYTPSTGPASSVGEVFKGTWEMFTGTLKYSRNIIQIQTLEKQIDQIGNDIEALGDLEQQFLDMSYGAMEALGLEEKQVGVGSKTKKEKKEKDLTSYLENMALRVKKLKDDLIEATTYGELDKQFAQITHRYEETAQELSKIIEQNKNKLDDKHKALTEHQQKLLREANNNILIAIRENEKRYLHELEVYAADVRIMQLQQANKTAGLKLEATREESEENFSLELELLKNNMEIEIAENNKLVEKERVDEADIRAKWNKKIEDLEKKHQDTMLDIRKKSNDILRVTVLDTDIRALQADLDNLNIEYSKAVNANELLRGTEGYINPEAIQRQYAQKAYSIQSDYYMKVFQLHQQTDEAIFNETTHSTLQTTRFKLQQDIDYLEYKLQLYEAGLLQLSNDEVQIVKSTIAKNKRELNDTLSDAFGNGVTSGILELLGFDDKQIQGFEQAKQQIINSLNEILEAEIEIAQKEIELQQSKVDAAQSAYDAEITARANGYANNVMQAKRELQLQQNTLRKKQQQAEKYQKAQQRIDSITQASSLVTATAEIWSSLSGIPYVGYILAAIATAGMFSAFIAAKVKAAQLTSTYGDGGLEFLQGGSHASGHDIDLGINNNRGRRMRAEGGEAVAVINKRKTRKYKALLPSIVNSLNDGTFESNFVRNYDDAKSISIVNKTNLGVLEEGVNSLVRNNKCRVIDAGDKIIVIDGNVTRFIRK